MGHLKFLSILSLVLLLSDKIHSKTHLNPLQSGEDQCYYDDPNPYEYYAGKTSYFTMENEDTTEITVSGKCLVGELI